MSTQKELEPFKEGQTVSVGEPWSGDLHQHPFVGTFSHYRNGNAVVEDQDGEAFEVDIENVTLQADALPEPKREESAITGKKIAIETYGCGTSNGVEYGLCLKIVHEGGIVSDDHELDIPTHDREEEEPENEEAAYNKYGQRDIMEELARNHNAHEELLEALQACADHIADLHARYFRAHNFTVEVDARALLSKYRPK